MSKTATKYDTMEAYKISVLHIHRTTRERSGKMTDTKAKILIYVAAALILLSPILPLCLAFGGGSPLFSMLPPAAEVGVPELALLESEDEMRGLWIATVNNINFPSKQGLSKKALQKELSDIVAFAFENGFNTILFQARPAADALYRSDIFPASKFVSGSAGKEADGGLDCLEYILNEAHKKGIKVHAWVNPLRVTSGNKTYPQTDILALPKDSPAAKNPEWVKAYADGKLYFDAGIPAVRELVAAGVREICENYDVDGIVFDDYFYPYPTDGEKFDDADTFAKYGSEYKSLADFRRDSVNKLVKASHDAVKAVDKRIAFGVSPFGIWQNAKGDNGGSATKGLSAYDEIYCDALAWVRGGYVDYIAPQLYWTFETSAAPYATLAEWWSRALDGSGVTLYINHGVYRYADGGMGDGELKRQVEYARDLYSYRGSMYYGYAALKSDAGGVLEETAALFENDIAYYDYLNDNSTLTLDSYENGDSTTSETVLICGKSNLAFPISVNGITPLRDKEGNYSITLSLSDGENLIMVSNGDEKCEILVYKGQ